MWRLMHLAAHCLAFGLPLLPVSGAPAAPPRQAPAVLRSNTRLVQLSVVVRDKKGEPVTDLKSSDFAVEDEGKRQEVRFFEVESQPGAAKAAVPLPQGVFSNRRAAHAGSAGGITIILLDGLNTRWGDQELARKNVLEYLSHIQPHDRVALYTLGKELKILQDFTEEPAELVNAVADHRRRERTPDLQASSIGMAIGGIDALLQEEANYFKGTRVSGTLTAFEAIANYLAGIPGRKNLLWVSGSFPLTIGAGNDDVYEALGADPRYSARMPSRVPYTPGPNSPNAKVTLTFGKEFQRVLQALNAADVAVYPVDARGLTTNPFALANVSTMKELAGGTGGKAYYDRNDLMNSIREAVQDSLISYTLAYYPSEQKPDGRFRKIRVKVNRPGLSLRYRPGYYDAGNSVSDENAATDAIREAVQSPLDATGVALDAQLDASDAALALRFRIGAGSLTLEERDGRRAGQIDLAFVQTDTQGAEHEVRLQTVPLQLAQDAYQAAMQEGIVLNKTLQRNKAATVLRVVVRDAASGRIGRVMVPFAR